MREFRNKVPEESTKRLACAYVGIWGPDSARMGRILFLSLKKMVEFLGSEQVTDRWRVTGKVL